MRFTRSLALAAVAAFAIVATASSMAIASPATGVTPQVLARGTFPAFKVASQQGPAMFKAEAKAPVDVVVRQHSYAVGGSTGWHAHPYPSSSR